MPLGEAVFKPTSSSRPVQRIFVAAGLILITGLTITGCSSPNEGDGGKRLSTSSTVNASESKDITANSALSKVIGFEEQYRAANGQYADTIKQLKTITETPTGLAIPKFKQVAGYPANVSASNDGEHYVAAVLSASGHVIVANDVNPQKKTYDSIKDYRSSKSPVKGVPLPVFE